MLAQNGRKENSGLWGPQTAVPANPYAEASVGRWSSVFTFGLPREQPCRRMEAAEVPNEAANHTGVRRLRKQKRVCRSRAAGVNGTWRFGTRRDTTGNESECALLCAPEPFQAEGKAPWRAEVMAEVAVFNGAGEERSEAWVGTGIALVGEV